MEFKEKTKLNAHVLQGYTTTLQLYRSPPTETISLKEFEELAEVRLKMLQKVDNIRQRASREGKHKGDDYIADIKNGPLKDMPLLGIKDSADRVELSRCAEQRRKDHISHYILRLAYCRSEEMRRWFLGLETEILKVRFNELKLSDRDEFFKEYRDEFNFQTVTAQESNLCMEESNFSHPDSFYRVPFTDALDLVQSRQVLIKNGYVYIPANKDNMITSLVGNKFRQKLSEELVKTRNHLPVVDDDERIAPMLKNIKHRYLGEDFSSVGSKLTGSLSLAQIDSVSKESFPPCMRHLHETLRKEHHLRHFGRLQYGLFLKSIGLTLEQALTFWRAEFVKKIEPDKFEKQYAYNVRHSYGKEGKRANYTPYSCLKIILSNTPGQGDHHGCPFRHWDEGHVKQMLTSHGISHKGVGAITGYLKDGHYQLACQRYYEITHAIEAAPFSLEHPSQYFQESRLQRGNPGVKQETLAKREPSTKPGIKTESVQDLCGDISVQDMENFDEDMDQF